MSTESTVLLYGLFADLLEYPTLATPLKAGLCFQHLQTSRPEAANLLERFHLEAEMRPLAQLEELYTVTFDMQPVCYPYVGYQLFGESYKRGAFMAQLNETYRASEYSAGQELPDHLSVILRFIGLDSSHRQGDFGQTLLNEGVMPALEKMIRTFGERSENPYVGLLSALRSFLNQTPEMELDHA